VNHVPKDYTNFVLIENYLGWILAIIVIILFTIAIITLFNFLSTKVEKGIFNTFPHVIGNSPTNWLI
jgi:hypothetical protein